jgi:hypothetical protein
VSEFNLRALERAATGGDLQARTRLFAERVRCGSLPRESLALAAYLGDPAAQDVTGEQPGPEAFSELTGGLWRWGSETLVRASIAAGRAWLSGWELECGWRASGIDGELALDYVAGAEWPRSADEASMGRRELEALEAWVCCPCSRHARAARESRDSALSPIAPVACALEEGSEWIERATVASLRDAARQLDPESIREALRVAVGGWALGEADPARTHSRLPRPTPDESEWLRRGWEAQWEGDRLTVSLGTWTESREGDDHQAVVHELDAELWRTRRWLAPRSGVDVDPFRALNAWASTRQWELRTGG